MFEFLFLFGPAALTYSIVRFCSRKTPESWFSALISCLSYAALDAAVTVLVMYPLDNVKIGTASGNAYLAYGATAFLFSLIVAVVWGLVISVLRTRFSAHVEISTREARK